MYSVTSPFITFSVKHTYTVKGNYYLFLTITTFLFNKNKNKLMLVAISITLQIKSTEANLLILHKVRNLFSLMSFQCMKYIIQKLLILISTKFCAINNSVIRQTTYEEKMYVISAARK